MILDKKNDKKGEYYRLGMIERQALTFENYASSEFGNRFYSSDFLDGICKRRNELHHATGKASGTLFLATTILAFFDHLQGATQFAGFTFSVPSLGPIALCVLIAISFLTTIMALIDQLIIDRLINTLGHRIGIQSFELLLLNHTAKNLWTLAMTPKYFGLGSQAGHKAVMGTIGLFYLVFGIIIIAYPITVVTFTFIETLSDTPSIIEQTLACISIFIGGFALIFLCLFSISYKFRPTGFSEPDDPYIPENFLDLGHPFKKNENRDSKKSASSSNEATDQDSSV